MTRADPSVGFDLRKSSDDFDPHILFFAKGFGPGGVERIVLRLTDGLRRDGLAITLMIGAEAGAMERPSGHCLVARPWPVIGTRWPMARLTMSLWRRLRRAPPALLFCPGNAYTIIPVLLKLLLGRACPPIVAKISNDLQRHDLPRAIRPLYQLWLWMQGRAIDHFAVLSASMGAEVQALMSVAPHRIHIVPNPVLDDVDPQPDIRQRRPDGAGRRFVAVGRLERQKDYPAMLRSFAAGARPLDRLTIFGEGRDRDALVAFAASLGIADRVDLPGHCRDVRARLRDHDVLLLSSHFEGQPGAVVEALSVGLGIIATRCCAGMSDLLDHGALGALVECGDHLGFARAIAQAQPDRQDRARAQAKIRHCTLEAAVPAYAALFAAVIAERQARPVMPGKASFFRPGTRVKPV